MSNITKLSWSFVDHQTTITADHMNSIVGTINTIIDSLDNSTPSVDPTPTPVSNVTISTSVTPSGSGSVTGGGSYAPGTSVTLVATAASGYTFQSWNDGNTNATRSITVGNSNASYTATFVENHPHL